MGSMRISGAVSGLDTEGLVGRLMALERRPVTIMRQRLQDLEERIETWQTLGSRLYDLQARLAAVAEEATYAKVAATTTNPAVATASGDSAPEGTYSITVSALAKAHTIGTAEYADATTALGLSGSPEINGQAIGVTAADSLNDLAAKINAISGIGVRASVVQVSPDAFRLLLVSTTTGTAGTISVVDDLGVFQSIGLVDVGGQPNTVQAGEDASLVINGLTVSRGSNVIDDAMPGLTINLTGLGTVAVTVSRDASAVVSAIQGFVQAYNTVADFINGQLTYDPQGDTPKPALYGESALRRLKSTLRSLATDPVSGLPESMHTLWQIGISTGTVGSTTARAGKLVVDEAKLRAALDSDLDGVKRLLGVGDTNVALASAGAAATASSEFDPVLFSAASAVDGRTDSERWGLEGGGWQDGTAGAFPDWLEIAFSGAKTIDGLIVYTLNSASYPADTYGVKDYSVEYWTGEQWLELAAVTGNTAGLVAHTFDPVTTDKVRLQFTAANGTNDHSRIVEVEVYEQNRGVASRLAGLCEQYTLSGSGLVAAAESSLDSQVKALNDQIESAERRLEMREASLYRRFVAMEQALSRLQNRSAWLTAQLGSLYTTRNVSRGG
jgi:flagellar hook-associated protein 2